MENFGIVVFCCAVAMVMGHGYMRNPPARNSMWRFGLPNPPNYSDNENFCGGRAVQIKNGGKCGVCGDPAHVKNQPHMDGGRYGNRIIGKTYKRGEIITVDVLLTASHFGYFEFRIGEFDTKPTSGDNVGKLNGYLMKLVSGGTKYPITSSGKKPHQIKLRLPSNLTCKRCVMQWWYRTGNAWGCDSEGCGLGHGAQEHFVNCADVRIVN